MQNRKLSQENSLLKIPCEFLNASGNSLNVWSPMDKHSVPSNISKLSPNIPFPKSLKFVQKGKPQYLQVARDIFSTRTECAYTRMSLSYSSCDSAFISPWSVLYFQRKFWSITVEPFINKDKKRCLFYIFKLTNIMGTVAGKGRLVKELADLVHCPF